MEKETETEWLFNKLWEEPKDKLTWNAILIKANEMEKKQIIDAVYDGMGTNFDPNMGRARQYYNQKYKQD